MGALGVVLVGYWVLWAAYPAAPANFDWQRVGVPATWNAEHNFTGFRRALEQELQFRKSIRSVVPEFVSARKSKFLFQCARNP